MILIVAVLLAFELAVVASCAYALTCSALGKMLQAALARSAVQAAPKRLPIPLHPSRFQSVAYTLLLAAQRKASRPSDAVRQTATQAETMRPYLYGKPAARFTRVEFSDFEYPFHPSFPLKCLIKASQGQIHSFFAMDQNKITLYALPPLLMQSVHVILI